jgi:hypothetical protein
MCVSFAPQLADQCSEDDAENVREKAQANFCDYFEPSQSAYAPGRMTGHERAQAEIETLFGNADASASPADTDCAQTDSLSDAEDLFKS